ncbi:MAG: hypothetical protein ABFS10_08970 [Bacteroidota bacterium]
MTNILILFIIGAMGIMGKPDAQTSMQEEVVWYGLDYTEVKFIGYSEHFSDLEEIRSHYFSAWNHLIIMESDKYDVKSAMGAGSVTYEVDNAILRSEKREMSGIVQSGSYALDKKQLASVIKAYTNPSVDKTGALLIMETLNKLEVTSTMWLVVFNTSTGEIHHLKRYSGEPGGFGFRNYWARSYYNVLKNLKSSPQKPL